MDDNLTRCSLAWWKRDPLTPSFLSAREPRAEARKQKTIWPLKSGTSWDRERSGQVPGLANVYKKRGEIAMLSMGKSTMSTGPYSIAMEQITRGYSGSWSRGESLFRAQRYAKIGWGAVNMSFSHIVSHVSPRTRIDSRIAQLMVRIPKKFGLFSPSNYPAW